MSDELKKFYKGRAKNPKLYDYDDDGNLIEKNKEGTIIKTIPLPNYRRVTYEEYDEMDKKRAEAIAVATKEYDDALRTLRQALTAPNIVDSEILRLNRNANNADIKLQSIRFPLKYVLIKGDFEIRDIDFSKPNEMRTYPYIVFFLNERPFTLQDQYVRIGKEAEKPLISVAEAKENALKESISSVILFEDPETNEYGYLSLKWVVQIEFNGTQYNSAHQAIAAEIAKEFNDRDNLQKIMSAETPDMIQYSLEDISGDSDTNEIKWNDLTKRLVYDVNIVKFKQYPELSARLLETQSATLGAYIPNDNLIGIGISLDNIQSKNPVNWTGQNLLGKALMDIRDNIRTERTISSSLPPPLEATVGGPLPRPIRRGRKPQIAPSAAADDAQDSAIQQIIPPISESSTMPPENPTTE